MRTSKINYFIVGMFVIVMIVGLVVSVALLTGRTGATDGYHAYYSNVTRREISEPKSSMKAIPSAKSSR